jgi:microcystin-dependent protein
MAGTHNFQIFDESMTSIDTDAEYLVESQRLNGVTPGLASPEMHNKLYRQCSVMAYAIASVIAARGYNADDSDPAGLVNALQRTFAFSVNSDVPDAGGAISTGKPLDAWPIGSLFLTMSSANPATLLGGGTWQQLQGKFLLASSGSYTAGNTYGSMTKTITVANLPAHTHGFTTSSNGAHTHSVSGTAASNGTHNHGASSASNGAHTHSVSGTSSGAGGHSHTRGSMNITGTLNVGANGYYTSGAFSTSNSNYPHIDANVGAGCLNYNFDASKTWTGSTSAVANHTHTISVTSGSNGAHTHTITVNNGGAHTHTTSGTAANNGNHTHTGTTNATGSGTALDVMPESIAVNVWRRTA